MPAQWGVSIRVVILFTGGRAAGQGTDRRHQPL